MVVVFDSEPQSTDDSVVTTSDDDNGSKSGARFLVRILQYLETPQYLRRRLFPMHNSLKFVGLLPPLDAPHHVREHEWSHYREDGFRQVVASMSPMEEMGLYWGYRVRYASNLSSVFKGSPFKDGYDHIIGTSEHGLIVSSSDLIVPTFRHLLIAFGGLAGLEESIEEDTTLKGKDARDVFDSYMNICPHQGSRTIRTEEAILPYFQEPIRRAAQQFEGK